MSDIQNPRFLSLPRLSLLVRLACVAVCCIVGVGSVSAAEKARKLVLLAGRPSHAIGEHEFRAGLLLLQSCLERVPGLTSVVYSNGWPASNTAFEGADAVIIYSDGGDGHPAIKPDRLKLLNDLADKGVGIGCMHYGVEVPKGEPGNALLQWIGGYFEMFWSVNPTWTAEFKSLPTHPITRGVRPFKIEDEWYYHMRFPEDMSRITPILSVVPPKETLNRPDGPHSGNPAVRKAVDEGHAQHLMWVFERANGGRGFGFTGGHFHKNWGNDDFRKLVLNAMVWVTHMEVPSKGIASTVAPAELKLNLDPKK